MINLATIILFSTYGKNLGNFLFNTCAFFANYPNFVCFILKKISHVFRINRYKDINGIHNLKQGNLNGFKKENKSMKLLNICSINDLDILNNSLLETETEINERLSTEVEDYDDDEYNFDFIDLVQKNGFEE